jgi:hypothetical protein
MNEDELEQEESTWSSLDMVEYPLSLLKTKIRMTVTELNQDRIGHNDFNNHLSLRERRWKFFLMNRIT